MFVGCACWTSHVPTVDRHFTVWSQALGQAASSVTIGNRFPPGGLVPIPGVITET
jgi:hypothetical protein